MLAAGPESAGRVCAEPRPDERPATSEGAEVSELRTTSPSIGIFGDKVTIDMHLPSGFLMSGRVEVTPGSARAMATLLTRMADIIDPPKQEESK